MSSFDSEVSEKQRKKDGSRREFLRTTLSAAVFPGNALTALEPSLASVCGVDLPNATETVDPFQLKVPQRELDDLRRRLAECRWPERETVQDWSQGAPLARTKELVDHWRTRYDWRRCETMLNSFGQFRTQIQGLGIHFLHVRSKHKDALPLVLTHGWPGSVIEFHKVIGPLTDPTAHGGSPEDAFHVVIPSLPGFGFSDKPTSPGWGVRRSATAWAELMTRLGYMRYAAQGGDFGAAVAMWMANQRAPGLVAIHLNFPILFPPPVSAQPTAEEKAALDLVALYNNQLSGYSNLQRTRPQTISYALTDSPVGQAAWIYEKFSEWTESSHQPESILTRDEMLDNIMMYWLSSTAGSSARMYWESWGKELAINNVDLPVGCSIFPGDLMRPPKVWAERRFPNLIYWNEVNRGGHFAAFEQPELFVRELSACFQKIRAS